MFETHRVGERPYESIIQPTLLLAYTNTKLNKFHVSVKKKTVTQCRNLKVIHGSKNKA